MPLHFKQTKEIILLIQISYTVFIKGIYSLPFSNLSSTFINYSLLLKPMLSFFQQIVEFLLLYKTSHFYSAHIILMVVIFVTFFYGFFREKQIIRQEENPPESKCHSKVEYVDYQRVLRDNTSKQLEKLEKSEQFQKFLRGRYDPTSRYYLGNKGREEVEEIVFSDEQQNNRRKMD